MPIKNIKSVFLFLAAFAASVVAETISNSHPKEHRGFYNSFDVGISYINFESHDDDARYQDKVTFEGFSVPVMEFRFGTAIGNLVAFYTIFNFTGYLGEANHSEVYMEDGFSEEYSDDMSWMLRTYVGFGSSIYPFRNPNSALNGFFVGGSVGYGLGAVFGDGISSGPNLDVDLGFTVEIGKEWWVNDHFSLGIGLNYFHGKPRFENNDSDNKVNGFQLMFRMTRG